MSKESETPSSEVYDELGHITRQLHSAVVQLGLDSKLQRIASEIPDARERLQYVGQLTERAAHRVLGLVETAQPNCRQMQADADALAARLQSASENAVLTREQAELLAEARQFVLRSGEAAERQYDTLSEIMLSQDFQDLSGQVIQKVVKIITETEDQLLGMLLRHAPFEASDLKAASPSSELQGPQVAGKALEQGDVDDLLASLGF
ncbi:MAG: protein phosphatase CheZ [Rubrivivax sp.]|nr:protein phosphatase CheZ [Rubrivivax sp.]